MIARIAALTVAAGLLVVLSGCLISTNTKTEFSGRYISKDTVNQIEPGKSKEDFILAVLGGPSSKTALSDGSEVWKWDYRKKKSSSGSVFLLVNADDHTETQGATYVVMREGIAEKVWQD